jgi:uncharacterized protein (TIGR03067 family)
MRRLLFLLAIPFVAPLLGFDSPKEYDSSTEANNIQGTWKLIESRRGSVQYPCSMYVSVYRDGKYVDRAADGHILIDGAYRINPTRWPPSLDHISPEGRVGQWIYRVDGDVLRMATHSGDSLRPNDFNEEGLIVLIFRRVK